MNSAENKKLVQELSETVECENDNRLNSKTFDDQKSSTPEHVAVKSLPNQISMRTRHRPRNKSVLQSAIARKELSLRVDDQPKQRSRRIKPKPSELGDIVLDPLVVSNTKNSPLKRVKRSSPRVTVKKKVLTGSQSSDEANNESSLDAHTRVTSKIADGNILDSSLDSATLSPPVIPSDQLEKLIHNDQLDPCYRMDLTEAVESCNAEKVAAILKLGNIDLNVTLESHNNGNLLHLAALKANTTILYLLVTSQVSLDLLDDDQHTPLMIAILEHKNDMVKYLVQAGANLTLKGIDGMTSLHLAAKSGNLEACKILLNSSFTMPNFVNIQDDGGWTPLVWACEHGHCEIIKYLVFANADITIRDVEHNAPLHWAAFKGSTEVVQLLLDLQSNVNVLNVHGDTPLHISSREDHYNCVLVLISRGADLSIINKNNETPLDCASKNGMCFNPLMLNAQLQLAFTDGKRRVSGLLDNDISKGKELNPIQCFNNIDSDEEPTDYTYVKKNCITTDNIYVRTKIDPTECCTCNDRCRSNDCLCAGLSKQTHYDEGKLPSDFNFEDPPTIFECNDLCSCNVILCSKRLVQKPLIHRFQLFKTISKGWAIKALHFIPTGSFVCEYIGEILTDSEAELREDDSYLFDLDCKEFDSFCIDAKLYGNFSRFINHSCHPNLHPVKVFIDHHDLRFPRIAFFAKRDILPNEELSFDYGDKFWTIKSFSCVCGAECCKYSGKSARKTLDIDASQSHVLV